jgi:hypothetical protein
MIDLGMLLQQQLLTEVAVAAAAAIIPAGTSSVLACALLRPLMIDLNMPLKQLLTRICYSCSALLLLLLFSLQALHLFWCVRCYGCWW